MGEGGLQLYTVYGGRTFISQTPESSIPLKYCFELAFCCSSWVAMFSSSIFLWNAGEPPFRLSLRKSQARPWNAKLTHAPFFFWLCPAPLRLSLRESQARPCDSEADACTFLVKALAFQSGTAREPGHALQHRTCAPRHLFH